MKPIANILASLMLLTAAGSVFATPLPVDTIPGGATVTSSTPFSFTINLNDDAPAFGLPLSSATLHLNLADSQAGNETYAVYFGTNTTAALADHNITGPMGFDIPLDPAALADLNADGLLTVTLKAGLQGHDDEIANYDFMGASLAQAPVTNQLAATSVPEPGSMALLGVSLLGFAAARRRSK